MRELTTFLLQKHLRDIHSSLAALQSLLDNSNPPPTVATRPHDTLILTTAEATPQPIPARHFYQAIQRKIPNLSSRHIAAVLQAAGYTRIKKAQGIHWNKHLN